MGRLLIKRYACAFPIKCLNCLHTDNIATGLPPSFTVDDDADRTNHKPIAIDCEMVGVGPKALNALGRISIIDYNGTILYDCMVRPEEEITDFRTRWSGIRPSDMRRSIPFDCAQEQVERILRGRIVVGHMVQNDFAVLRMKHPPHLIRDTARAPYAKIVAGFPANQVIGLRALTLRLFGVQIQQGEHCSTEDARATMAIYRLVEEAWERSLQKIELEHVEQLSSPSKLLSSSVCELNRMTTPVASHQLKRSHKEFAASVFSLDTLCTDKRRCLPSSEAPKSQGLKKSSSSTSLLDDDFWPN